MSRVSVLHRARLLSQVAVMALLSAAMAGCSGDTNRFGSNPFAGVQASRPNAEVTGSVPQSAPQHSAPVSRVESQPLPQTYSQPAQTYPAYQGGGYQHTSGVSGGGNGLGSYQPPASRPVETTASTSPRSVAATRPAVSGTPIIVGSSDTIDTLARRYNVSAADIMRANNLSGPRAIQPGQRLVIPRNHTASVQSAPQISAPAATPTARQSASHTVSSGETLMSLSRRYKVSLHDLAKANNLTARSHLKIGDKVVIPGAHAPAMTAKAETKIETAKPQKVASAEPAPAQPVQKARVASATPDAEMAKDAKTSGEATSEPVKSAEATGGLPSFRWPVRGRVIASYGAKTNGKANDGINVSVPEGTPIKAAEDGVVAYAGNELKGYGNLVLVRHSNGYVSAYAHASEIEVKRGDSVKRGQVLGKAGQTGDVTSPQLHFEIRKGSSPVDPTKFLNGA